MTGNTMMMIGAGLAVGSILMEIILGIVFRATRKRMIKKIYEDLG